MTSTTYQNSSSRSSGEFRREWLPAASSFYQKELGKLSRPSRGWARGNCPFHKSESKTSFSVNLDTGGFYCFGCNVKGGDVLSFVMKRDHLDFVAAAKSLGAWSDISSTSKTKIASERKSREDAKAKQLEEQEAERQARIESRTCLHNLERSYAKINLRLATLRRGAPEKFTGETDYCWQMLSTLTDKIRRAEHDYRALAGVRQ